MCLGLLFSKLRDAHERCQVPQFSGLWAGREPRLAGVGSRYELGWGHLKSMISKRKGIDSARGLPTIYSAFFEAENEGNRSISACSRPQVLLLTFLAERGHRIFQPRRHSCEGEDLAPANKTGACSLRNQVTRIIIGFCENLKEMLQVSHPSTLPNWLCAWRTKARSCDVHILLFSPDKCISLHAQKEDCTPRKAANL